MKEKEWYQERNRETLRMLAHEQERLTDEAKRLEEQRRMAEGMESLMDENERLQEETEALQQQLANERQKRTELEMNLTETRKLMDSIAKKSSEEGVQKAIQTFVNYSKRKTSDKRAYIKTTLLEFTSVNRISLPEEVSATIDCFDDVQAGPRTVVNGDLVQNKHVENEVDKVEPGATGITINKKQS